MKIKKLLASVLVICIAAASLSFPSSAADGLYLDSDTAIVMIPGLSMNSVFVRDKSGVCLSDTKLFFNQNAVQKALPSLVGSLFMSSIFNIDIGLSKSVANAVGGILPGFDKKNTTSPAVFDKPLSEYNVNDYYYFSYYVDLSSFNETLSRTYLYNYDDMGSIRTAADGLNDFIQDVVVGRGGYSNVILCPISLGSSVAALFLDLYPESHSLIKKIIFMVAAADGTDIIGELLTKDLTIISSPEALAETLFEYIRLPKAAEKIVKFLFGLFINDRNFDTLCDAVLFGINDSIATTAIWALCPLSYYQEARRAYLMRGCDDEKRAEIDRLMEARQNLKSNLDNIVGNGGKVFTLSGYGLPLDQFFDSEWLRGAALVSSDTIVPTYSSSLGATTAPLGQAFESGYVSTNPVCTDPCHNHISPDRLVDASTCMFPETSWFFRGVTHAGFGCSRKALELVKSLACDNGITDIHSDAAFPQFIF